MHSNENVYEVDPGTGPSTRTIADAGAVEERRRYYATDMSLWEFPSRMRTPIDDVLWGQAICDEDAVANTEPKGIRLRATDRESALIEAKAMREGAKPAPAPVAATKPAPAPHPAPDAAQAWAENQVRDEPDIGEQEFPGGGCCVGGFLWYLPGIRHDDATKHMRNSHVAAFNAGRELGKAEGVAHERARVEGLCKEKSNGTYYWTRFVDDIRSGRDLRTEAK